MNWRTTAVLFVLLAGLVGYSVWDNQREPAPFVNSNPIPPPPPTPQTSTLVSTSSENVQFITIENLEEATEVAFAQDDVGEWLQTAPSETQVVSATLNTAVIGLINLRSSLTIPADANPLSAYGLDQPSHQITVSINQPEQNQSVQVRLLIGNLTPTESAYYVQKLGDARVHVLSVGIIDTLLDLDEIMKDEE